MCPQLWTHLWTDSPRLKPSVFTNNGKKRERLVYVCIYTPIDLILIRYGPSLRPEHMGTHFVDESSSQDSVAVGYRTGIDAMQATRLKNAVAALLASSV